MRAVLHPARWPAPLQAWVVSRLVVFAAAVIASWLWGPPLLGVDSTVPRLLSTMGGWDTSWYLDIARRGYQQYTDLTGVLYTNFAFFPLLPLVMKAGMVVGLNPFLFGMAVSNVAFLGALTGLHRISVERYGEARGRTVLWTAAVFPASAYASMAYTEGITLLLVITAALMLRHHHWVRASLVAGVAVLARPPGVLASVLVALFAWYGGGDRATRIRRCALALAPAVVLLIAYLVWTHVTRGSWSLPFVAQSAWKRGGFVTGVLTHMPVEIGDSIRALLRLPGSVGSWDRFSDNFAQWWSPVVRDGAPTILYAYLLRRLWRMEGTWKSPWFLYAAAALAMPLSSGSFTSMGRFGLMAFPLAWAGAAWLDEGGTRRRRRWLVIGLVLLAASVAEMQLDAP